MLRNQPGIKKDRHSEFNTGKPLSYPREERRWFPWATCAEPRSTEEASNKRQEHRSKVAVARGAASGPRGLKLPWLLPLSDPPAFYPCLLWTIPTLNPGTWVLQKRYMLCSFSDSQPPLHTSLRVLNPGLAPSSLQWSPTAEAVCEVH